MRKLLPALAAGTILLSGCGGDDDDGRDLGPALDQRSGTTATEAPAPQTTPTAAAPATTTKRQAAKPKVKRTASANQPSAVSATRRVGANTHNVDSGVPIACLKRAKLTGSKKQSDGVWQGKHPELGTPVIVDGPYEDAKDAKSSAASLDGVSNAEAGGRYVVSAALRSPVKAEVKRVARCIAARS